MSMTHPTIKSLSANELLQVEQDLLHGWRRLQGGERWTKRTYFRDADGKETTSCNAHSYCAVGALLNLPHSSGSAIDVLRAAVPTWCHNSIFVYNDHPRCKFRHIEALYGKALKLVRDARKDL